MKRFLLASAAIVGTVFSAHAADMAVKAPIYKAPPLPSVYDWTGFYMGVNAGVGLGRDRTIHYQPTSENSFYQSAQGGFGGGQIGYNWQAGSILGFGPIVWGIEADIQGSGMSDSRTVLNTFLTPNAYSQKVDWFGTVRGRVGIATGPVLSYVTAGYAYGNIKSSVTAAGVGVLNDSTVQGGWTYGSGLEAALGGNWTGRIEYLYMHLGDHTFEGPGNAITQEIRQNVFRVGLNYRIGGNSNYVPVAAANWNGWYLGGNIGAGTGRNRTTLGLPGGTAEQFNLSPDGFNGGAQIGYNWQAGNWVWGVETDFQGSAQKDNKTCILTCTVASSADYQSKLPWFGTVRGRLGYSAGPALFYVTGGYAYGSVKTDADVVTGAVLTRYSSSRTQDGWTAGAGIESPFSFLGHFRHQLDQQDRISLRRSGFYDRRDRNRRRHSGADLDQPQPRAADGSELPLQRADGVALLSAIACQTSNPGLAPGFFVCRRVSSIGTIGNRAGYRSRPQAMARGDHEPI